jgi:hypothetical protein
MTLLSLRLAVQLDTSLDLPDELLPIFSLQGYGCFPVVITMTYNAYSSHLLSFNLFFPHHNATFNSIFARRQSSIVTT